MQNCLRSLGSTLASSHALSILPLCLDLGMDLWHLWDLFGTEDVVHEVTVRVHAQSVDYRQVTASQPDGMV